MSHAVRTGRRLHVQYRVPLPGGSQRWLEMSGRPVGDAAANWGQLGEIAASWVISPVMGAAIAAAFLYWIKRSITWRGDMIGAARRTVPLMIGLMVFAFSAYLVLKGLNRVWQTGVLQALGIGTVLGVLGWRLAIGWVRQRLPLLANTKAGHGLLRDGRCGTCLE